MGASGIDEVVKDFHDHVAKVGLSFSDDSVTLICTRDECMEGGYWWQREIPYMCTPEIAMDLRNKHVRGDW